MKRYTKNGEINYRNKIIINNDVLGYVINPTEEMLFEDGWVEYIEPEPTLKELKSKLLNEIRQYDKSLDVNSFFIGKIQTWIDRDTRVSLMNSTNILKEINQETTTLWLGNQSFTLPCDSVIQMLRSLEVYALQCYNVTAQHKANVQNLNTREEIETYDFKAGYPEKLVFNV